MVVIDAGTILNMFKLSEATLNRDRSRDLGLDKEGIHHYEFSRFLLVCGDSNK
jgi:hypothetical protein